MKRTIIYSCLILVLFAFCKEDRAVGFERLVREWSGKTINFPHQYTLYLDGKLYNDTTRLSDFKIVSYVDSVGCASCKLKLKRWKDLIIHVGSVNTQVSFAFFIHPSNVRELKQILRKEKFEYPVCIDEENELNRLNNFPSDVNFHTFLIDKNNKVLAIGNPIDNPKVKELYLNIIQGKKIQPNTINSTSQTSVSVDNASVSLDYFYWQEEQKTSFVIKNTGSKPLVIQDINTSCGCTTVSYSKEPVQPGKEIKLDVAYKADHPEHFSKTITVYCNAESSPIKLTISGDAE